MPLQGGHVLTLRDSSVYIQHTLTCTNACAHTDTHTCTNAHLYLWSLTLVISLLLVMALDGHWQMMRVGAVLSFSRWCPEVQNIFYQGNKRKLVPSNQDQFKLEHFYNCAATLMTSHLQSLLLDSLSDFTDLLVQPPVGDYNSNNIAPFVLTQDSDLFFIYLLGDLKFLKFVSIYKRHSLLATIQDCTTSETADNSHTDESHSRGY